MYIERGSKLGSLKEIVVFSPITSWRLNFLSPSNLGVGVLA